MESHTSVSTQIKQQIIKKGRGEIYFSIDFFHLENDRLVRQTLFRLEKEEFLVRLAKGIYLYPKIDKEIGILRPSITDIAQAIAKRDKAEILETGVLALNILGLSTQVPVNYIFGTTGSARSIPIGKRKIIFKKLAPKYFRLKSPLSHLIIFSLQEIGAKNLTPELKNKLKILIEKSNQQELLSKDILIASEWIRKIIRSILNGTI